MSVDFAAWMRLLPRIAGVRYLPASGPVTRIERGPIQRKSRARSCRDCAPVAPGMGADPPESVSPAISAEIHSLQPRTR